MILLVFGIDIEDILAEHIGDFFTRDFFLTNTFSKES